MTNDKWKMENRFTVLGSFSVSEVLLGCPARVVTRTGSSRHHPKQKRCHKSDHWLFYWAASSCSSERTWAASFRRHASASASTFFFVASSPATEHCDLGSF